MLKQLLFATVLLAAAGPALAQEHPGEPASGAALPDVCTANAEPHGDMTMGSAAIGSDAPHMDLMDGMDKMNADMMTGATAPDIDVAFVCSMIPHHQGAVEMAQVAQQFGSDPWINMFAQEIISAQQVEIAEMQAWLTRKSQQR